MRASLPAGGDQQLAALLEHVREGLARLDRGEIDVFEFDELIERYQRARAQALGVLRFLGL